MIDSFFWVYMIMLFVRILSSWVPEYGHLTIMRFVAHYTDPYLNLFRKIIPPIGGMLDLSPMVALFSLQILEWLAKWPFR